MSKELKKWMPMFWPEYLADTGHLNAAEHGAYLLLIGHYWMKGCVPWDNEELVRRITKMTPRQWSLSRDVLRSFFGDDGRHKRCDEELAYALEKSKRLSANAKLRHSNGIPVADTPTPTPTKKERKTPTVAEPPEFDEFWKSKPKREGPNPRLPALKSYQKAIREGADPAQINAAAKRWASEISKTEPKFISMAVTWLNQRRFEDYQAEAASEDRLKIDYELLRSKGFVCRDGKWMKVEETHG